MSIQFKNVKVTLRDTTYKLIYKDVDIDEAKRIIAIASPEQVFEVILVRKDGSVQGKIKGGNMSKLEEFLRRPPKRERKERYVLEKDFWTHLLNKAISKAGGKGNLARMLGYSGRSPHWHARKIFSGKQGLTITQIETISELRKG